MEMLFLFVQKQHKQVGRKMNTSFPLTIYYDSSCAMCNQEMSRLKQHDQSNKLLLIDCSSPDFVRPSGAPDTSEMMKLLHVRTVDGAWIIGVPAIRLAYAGVGINIVSDWLGKPYINRMMNRLYPMIARHRYLIPAWLTTAWFNWLVRQAERKSRNCANGQCET